MKSGSTLRKTMLTLRTVSYERLCRAFPSSRERRRWDDRETNLDGGSAASPSVTTLSFTVRSKTVLKLSAYFTELETCRPYSNEATTDADRANACDQGDATGFIRLNALRLKVAAKVQRRK